MKKNIKPGSVCKKKSIFSKLISGLLEFNTVWRAYRVMPALFTSFCLYMVYTVVQGANMMQATWDLGAVLTGMGIFIERVLKAYKGTGDDAV